MAYYWCRQTNRLIQKPPGKRAGQWVKQNGIFFMYADKALGPFG